MKILYITHLSGKRVNRFWISSIQAAQDINMEFHLACNMNGCDKKNFPKDCEKYHITSHQIDFDRNPLKPVNIKAYSELVDLLQREHFDIIHCNTPIGGVIGRLAAHKVGGAYVIYQAHGFHFWKGAPIKNWLFYYPVEKFLSRYTDTLITINKEDYNIAKNFYAKEVVYVPGVGIDLSKFQTNNNIREQKRKELGLKKDDIVILSVGELIPRKNHKMVIDAICDLKDRPEFERVQYLICGAGELQDELKSYISERGVEDHVHLLGFRLDVNEIYNAADIFVFMSLQEGLPVALMEAMASGLVCIASNIRGNNDLIIDKYNGRLIPIDEEKLAHSLYSVIRNTDQIKKYGKYATEIIKDFTTEKVVEQLRNIYLKRLLIKMGRIYN
ncbi:glycosyltransferase family 4 protein [Limosilactobacillus fermentum]|uniref:glycosyltransferase family 4 protein n=1 Tax=Limosilactobacillus fermentum TaxID=1613 RepID=UPI00124B7049|nr:glycosyltransferase family 4 protein [Limosilactobacillus fermentum]KAB1953851.1 glycosyltransferase family 4 protein [Limosilactobacillus fermentum]